MLATLLAACTAVVTLNIFGDPHYPGKHYLNACTMAVALPDMPDSLPDLFSHVDLCLPSG